MTWGDMAVDNLKASKRLLTEGHWRSCVSRAYYAAYARATAELESLATFPPGREGPSHDDLPDMAFDYLTRLSTRERRRFSTTIARMYQWRLSADYHPSLTIDEAIGRDAVTWCDLFFKAMEEKYG